MNANKESQEENNIGGLEEEFGLKYEEDDNENENEEMPPKEIITSSNSRSRIKKSSFLGNSINNSIFGFNAQNDELKKKSDLYKKRDDFEDIKEEEEIKSSMKSNDNL